MNDLAIETEVQILRPEGLPEKFWDEEKQEVRLDALVKSYTELEKKLSTTMPVPQSEEDKINLLHHLGLPESPDGYEIDVSHGLFNPDPEVNTRLHAKGLTPEQVQEVYNLAAEKLVPMIAQLAGDFQADREVERLSEFFGGAEKWSEVSRQLLAFGKKNLPEDVLESLSSTYEGVIALYRMMKSQDPNISKNADVKTGVSEGDLHSMMRDPKYWRERDPSFVSKVTEGFKSVYGE
jgi:hypothetical protein